MTIKLTFFPVNNMFFARKSGCSLPRCFSCHGEFLQSLRLPLLKQSHLFDTNFSSDSNLQYSSPPKPTISPLILFLNLLSRPVLTCSPKTSPFSRNQILIRCVLRKGNRSKPFIKHAYCSVFNTFKSL